MYVWPSNNNLKSAHCCRNGPTVSGQYQYLCMCVSSVSLFVSRQSKFPAEWSPSKPRLCPPPPSRWAGTLQANPTAPSWATDCCGPRARPPRNRSATRRRNTSTRHFTSRKSNVMLKKMILVSVVQYASAGYQWLCSGKYILESTACTHATRMKKRDFFTLC